MTHVPGKSYVVGGAVRDRLLGLPVSDRDHVVVGTTVEAMKAAGFKPVGRDFPVFLHPETHEEYALARTERKVARGYAGFVFHADPAVTLEADLERRDLTINAMAEDETSGAVVDPFGGRRDLEARLFRHVGASFVEDPVRVLRLARFAARFHDFTVAPETLALTRSMADAGEIDALVPERVWQELSRGLMEQDPVRMFDVLRDAAALPRLMPELTAVDAARWRVTASALTRAAAAGQSLEVRFAVTMHAIDHDAAMDSIEQLCMRFAVPRAARELAVLGSLHATALQETILTPAIEAPADLFVAILDRTDAFRRRRRFLELIDVIVCLLADDVVRSSFAERVRVLLEVVDAVDIAAVVRHTRDPAAIQSALRSVRVAALTTGWPSP